MNATEHAALLDGLKLHDELTAAVDARTLEILERRRRTAVVRRRGWLVRRMLLAADVVGLLVALVAAEWLVSWRDDNGQLDARAEVVAFIASLPAWVVIAKLYGLYDRDEERTDHSTADDFAGVFHMVTVCTWLFWVITQVTGAAHPSAPKLVLFWAAAVVSVSTGRACSRAIARRNPIYLQNAVIVGAGDVGQLIAKKVLQHPEYGINLVGFVDADPKARRMGLEHLALLGGVDRLSAIVRLFDVERVIVAFSNDSHEETLGLIRDLKELDVDLQIDVVPRLFELTGAGVRVHTVEGLPLVSLPPARLSRSSKLLKRSMDVLLGVATLFALAPLFLAVAILVKLDSRGPVFFRQVRMGCGDRTFRIYKFRSMYQDAEEQKSSVAHLNKHLGTGGDARMFKVRNDPRVTRVGGLLRRLSLDELPQLLNVIKGEMSLVGPRPLILDEDQHVEAWARRRLELRPGITGLWQVHGRSEIPFAEMVKLDYLYVTTWSIWEDLRLVLRTLPALFGRGAGE
jgi:exopolysaccharide biosynthesis polyprenyl glycosylphosphotransferase